MNAAMSIHASAWPPNSVPKWLVWSGNTMCSKRASSGSGIAAIISGMCVLLSWPCPPFRHPSDGLSSRDSKTVCFVQGVWISVFRSERLVEGDLALHADLVGRHATFEEVGEFLHVLQVHERERVARPEVSRHSELGHALVCAIFQVLAHILDRKPGDAA